MKQSIIEQLEQIELAMDILADELVESKEVHFYTFYKYTESRNSLKESLRNLRENIQ